MTLKNTMNVTFENIGSGDFFLYSEDDSQTLCMRYLGIHTIGNGTKVNAIRIRPTPGESLMLGANHPVISCSRNVVIEVKGT